MSYIVIGARQGARGCIGPCMCWSLCIEPCVSMPVCKGIKQKTVLCCTNILGCVLSQGRVENECDVAVFMLRGECFLCELT